jgi:hypothetical protein
MQKFMQNSYCQKEIYAGGKKGQPVYVKVNVVTTNKKVIVYDLEGNEIGQAGVIREKDFDFNTLYQMAIKQSGKSIQVA